MENKKPKLYYAPGTCALACWISLEWAGAEYEVEKVDYSSPDFKKINPLGAVPALDIGYTRALTQAGAILNYISEKFSNNELGADEGDVDNFIFNETMLFLTGDFHPAFWPLFFPSRYTTDSSEEALNRVKEASFARIDRALTHLDSLIGDTNHVYKNKRTIADAYAFVMSRWSEYTPKSWREYPNLSRFMESMMQDETVKKVLELSQK